MKYFFSLLVTCLALATTVLSEESSNNLLNLGFIGPLTGSAAILGADAVPAMQIAIDEENKIGDVKINLTVEDDQYQTAKSISAYERLVRYEQIKVLFVLTYGGVFALKNRVISDNTLVIDTLDCDQNIAELPNNYICISKLTEDLGEVVAQVAFDRNETPAGYIYYESDPFMGIVARASKAKLEKLGGKTEFFEGYQAGTSDFRSLLLKAKNKNLKSLFFFGYDELGSAMKQAKELGIKIQFYGLNTVSSPDFRASARGAEEGTIVSTFLAPRNSRFDNFISSFRKLTSKDSPTFEVSTFPSYDAVKLLVQGLRAYLKSDRKIGKVDFLRRYLLQVKNYSGLSGNITIDSDGATRSITGGVYQIRNGVVVPYP